MGRARFDQAGFLAAARELIAERGPAAVSIDAVAERLKAPKGSFYYRFASRDALLGELWLKTVLAYQEGFVAAIEAGDGLGAALHTPAWARRHLDDARLLMLYSRHDFVQGDWPAPRDNDRGSPEWFSFGYEPPISHTTFDRTRHSRLGSLVIDQKARL